MTTDRDAISPDELCELVGAKIDDSAILRLRDRLGKCEATDSSCGPIWHFDRDGIWFAFRTDFGDSLEMIYLFGAGAEPRVLKYKHPLPAELKFRMHYEDVKRVLAPSVFVDKWGSDFHPFGDLALKACYDDNWKLNQVVLMPPKSAAELGAHLNVNDDDGQPPCTASLASGYAELLGLLGSTIDDRAVAEFRSRFAKVVERFEQGSNIWCFLETRGRQSGFQLSFDSHRDDRLGLIVLFGEGREPAHAELLQSLPQGIGFGRTKEDIRGALGNPIDVDQSPDDYFFVEDHLISVSYLPRSGEVTALGVHHSEVAKSMGFAPLS